MHSPAATPARLVLSFARKRVPVSSFEEASRIYSDARDASGEGASHFKNGKITRDGVQVAQVSYNGKVWAGSVYVPNATPLFDPYDTDEERQKRAEFDAFLASRAWEGGAK